MEAKQAAQLNMHDSPTWKEYPSVALSGSKLPAAQPSWRRAFA
jgi:hypothetical protein